MAYGLRYTMHYTSPMRDKRSYYVIILQDGYEGDPIELYSCVDGLTLTHGKRDSEELTPIIPSELTLRVKVLSDPERYKELYSDDPRQCQIIVSELCRDTTIPIWQGYVSSGQYEQPVAALPFDLTIRANDGFEILKNTQYEESRGVWYTGIISLRDLIERLLEPLQLTTSPLIWGIDDIEPMQTAETADLIGLSNPGIYAVFDGKAPTHYELLDAVLRNYGLQIFQMLGKWHVRPLFTLAQVSRPSWYTTSLEQFGILSRNAIYPLHPGEGDGIGLSSAATLSMKPPMREMTISGAVDKQDYVLKTIYLPDRWLTRNAYENSVNPLYRTHVGRGTQGVRIFNGHYTVTGEHHTAWLGYAFDGLFGSTDSSIFTLSFKAYNLRAESAHIEAAIFAVPADIDPLGWLKGTDLANVTIPDGVHSYSPAGIWGNVGGNSGYVMDSLFNKYFELEKATKNFPFTQLVSLSRLPEAECLFEFVGIPALDDGNPARLVLVLSTAKDEITAFEMADVHVSAEYAVDIVETPAPSTQQISSYGSESISFDRKFAESGSGTLGCGAFAISSVRVDTGEPIRGFLAPSNSLSLSQIVGSRLRNFRGCVSQTFEGDLYSIGRFDFNTVWQDDEGKLYYATYIQEITRRGLHNVQLQQLPPYTTAHDRWILAAEDVSTGTLIAFDTTIMCLSGNRLLMMDIVAKKTIEVATFEGEVSSAKGVGSICITEYLGEVYNLYAYDAYGNLLSRVQDVYKSVTSPTTDAEIVAMPHNARYDSTISSWTIVGNVDAKSDKLQISVLDKDGAQLVEDTTTYGRLTGAPHVFAGGFAFAVTPLTASAPTIMWHNYYVDDGIECTSVIEGKSLLGVNDTWLIVGSVDEARIYVYQRGSSELGTMLISLPATFCDANNALILARVPGNYLAMIDGRSGEMNSVILDPEIVPVLVGDKIVFMYGTMVMIINLITLENGTAAQTYDTGI